MVGWTESRIYRLLSRWRNLVILVVLAASVATSPPAAERYGDRVQYALPLMGLGCTVLSGGTIEYLARYVTAQVMVDGSKWALGETQMNDRPRGGYSGFPSGHSMAAAFGASALVHECISGSPLTKAVVVIAAGFTGASRVDAGAHTIWQVLAGWIVGFGVERAFRRRIRRWRAKRSDIGA